MMKLGMLIPEFPTQTHIFFWREVEALRDFGVDVRLISTRRPPEGCPHAFAETAIKQTHYVYPPSYWSAARHLLNPLHIFRGLKYIWTLSEGWSRKFRAFGYLLCAADLVAYAQEHQLDHIHVHSCSDAAHIAAMARLIGSAPYSLHLHGDLEVYGTDHHQKSAGAAFVCAAARTMQQQLIDIARVPIEKTYTMWMGVDTSNFKGPTRALSVGRSLHLVSIGRLHLCKGHRYTLQAIRKLLDAGLDIRYTIAGTGPHQHDVASSVAEGNFGDRVQMVGSLGDVEVGKLLNSADAFVLSSVGVGEASPVAVMEAMSAGIPVISSIIGGTPDMIEDGVDGLLVDQKDVTALSNAIRLLHDDPEFRTRLSIAARKRACSQFDYRVTSRKLLTAIEKSRV
jgi:colanic acid/amylovoran biosynthesis glycosyltransferase